MTELLNQYRIGAILPKRGVTRNPFVFRTNVLVPIAIALWLGLLLKVEEVFLEAVFDEVVHENFQLGIGGP